MTLGAAIRTRLIADAAIAAAVSDRIFPVQGLPVDKDTVVPDHIVYSQESEATMDAISGGGSLAVQSVYSFESVCDPRLASATSPYDRCDAISLLIQDSLHGYNETAGLMGGVGGVQVMSVEQIDRQDTIDILTGLFVKSQTFKFTWRR